MNEQDRIMLRAMAWERAKGELRSILNLYQHPDQGFEDFADWLEAQIKEVEDNGIGCFT